MKVCPTEAGRPDVSTPPTRFHLIAAPNEESIEQKIANLFVPYWRGNEINRQQAARALSGVLMRRYGWPRNKVKKVIMHVCEGSKDRGVQSRLKEVDRIARQLSDNQMYVPGVPTLKKIFGKQMVSELLRVIPQGVIERTRKPEIDASIQDLRVISEMAWDALRQANVPPRLFLQGNCPRRIEHGDNGMPILRDMNPSVLRYELARVADWYVEKPTTEGEVLRVDAKPPMDVVQDMLAAPDPPLPSLTRIVGTPVFAPDGTLQTEPGYHAASRTYYEPSPDFIVPDVAERPTREDIDRAKNVLLDELLRDFPFDREADRAHALALGLLPLVRDLIDGATPLHLIESPTPGSGKDLLVDAMLRPSCGRNIGLLMQTSDEEEWRKRLTSSFREASPVICIDNVTKPLDSGVLAGALTAHTWRDRLLGATQTLALPVRCTWVATANNPTMSTEIARRSIRIRLDPNTDRPWLRDGFRHEDLRAWGNAHRGELVRALLTLTRAWIAAGRPRPKVKPLGSFEEWSYVLGGILETAGVPGFLSNLGEFYEAADSEGDTWRGLVEAWAERFGQKPVTAADLFPLAIECGSFDFKNLDSQAERISFGKLLARQRDRVIGDYRITAAGKVKRAAQWRLALRSEAR